jgi:tripartite-type tricarboxylate transporter receptor subunit TctC
VTTARRSVALPNVATVAEGGVSGYEYQDWWGMFSPAATPLVVTEKLGKEVARILELSEIRQQMLGQGEEASPSSPNEFAKFVREKVETARKLATLAGIRAD